MVTRIRATLAVAIALALICPGCRKSPAAPTLQPVDVFTPGNTFSPFSTRVTAGTVVRFNIFGDDHNVIFSHSAAGYPDDINVSRDVVVSRTFSTTGTFSFSCTVHPGMIGEVVVQ
jgi:plastocyanin